MAGWAVGQPMLIYLAGLQGIDQGLRRGDIVSTVKYHRGPALQDFQPGGPAHLGQPLGDSVILNAKTLVAQGYQVRSVDIKPFDEWYQRVNQCIFLSATPSDYE